ncbi:hypothetical protein RRG08_049580 [Elysia crispata]|uniref:Uncharacterized protein n=1 Tax=Elysia crispata TaxID=231223 RepID=A0AAE1AUD1_9GAST|nr:hypothetical protein RRG08_049580 [Elysia crispata]
MLLLSTGSAHGVNQLVVPLLGQPNHRTWTTRDSDFDPGMVVVKRLLGFFPIIQPVIGGCFSPWLLTVYKAGANRSAGMLPNQHCH